MLNFSDHKKEIFPPLYIYKPVLIVACGSQILRLYMAINYLYCLLKFITLVRELTVSAVMSKHISQ